MTSGRSQTVTYDDLNRIHTASEIYIAQTYAYDGVGNRQSLAVGGTTTSYTYSPSANQISGITYSASPPATGSGAYLFNAFNQRVQKTVSSATIQFIYDEAGRLLEEANGSGTVQKEYIWLDDMPIAMVDSTGSSPILYFIHTDQIGTPQKITDGSMNIVWDGVFDPFGNSAGGSSLSLTNLRFPGQYFDNETALNQSWNRDYDPTTGRYIQSDTWGLAGGINTYAYVSDDPLTFYDPDGLCGTKTCVGEARILKGNKKLIGKQGAFPNTSVASNTAAVIPGQFGFPTAAKMAPYISQITGVTSNGLTINGVSDIIGGKSPTRGVPVRDALQQIYPGRLILELPSAASDPGIVGITLTIPVTLNCPTGLVEKK